MLLMEANERLKNNEGKTTISFETILSDLGITERDLEEMEDVDIE